MEQLNFTVMTDEELINRFFIYENKTINNMMLMSQTEMDNFLAIEDEIKRRDLNGEIENRRNNPDSKGKESKDN